MFTFKFQIFQIFIIKESTIILISFCVDLDRGYDDFDGYVHNEIDNWVQFHEYWMSTDRETPVYIVRYEELLINTNETLRKII